VKYPPATRTNGARANPARQAWTRGRTLPGRPSGEARHHPSRVPGGCDRCRWPPQIPAGTEMAARTHQHLPLARHRHSGSGRQRHLGWQRDGSRPVPINPIIRGVCDPEAPRDFAKLIRRWQEAPAGPTRLQARTLKPAPADRHTVVSNCQWFLLFRNGVFRSFCRREGKIADTSDSAYEFHLVKACFCCGLTVAQIEAGSGSGGGSAGWIGACKNFAAELFRPPGMRSRIG